MAETGTDAPAGEVEAEWIRVFDSRHQRHYFFNATTGESQWIKPKGVPVAEAPEDMQARADQALGGGTAASAAAGDSKATTRPAIAAAGAAAVPAPDSATGDGSPIAGSPTGQPKGGAKKLRSFAKGVANILGLRKRHASKDISKDDMTTNPLASPVAAPAVDDDGRAIGGPETAEIASLDPVATTPAASGSSAAAGVTASAEAPAAGADTEAADADGTEVASGGSGRLTRTLSDGNIRPELKRVRSILKRSSTMHAKSERRISFADQSGRSLANVVYCDNLHYSQPDTGVAPPDPEHGDDDGNCGVM